MPADEASFQGLVPTKCRKVMFITDVPVATDGTVVRDGPALC